MELWTVLVPILLADVLNPVLLGAMIFTLGSSRPLLAIGAFFLADAAWYLIRGEPLVAL